MITDWTFRAQCSLQWLSPPQNVALSHIVTQSGQESGVKIKCKIFKFYRFGSRNLYKQCLQTGSGPDPLPGLRP